MMNGFVRNKMPLLFAVKENGSYHKLGTIKSVTFDPSDDSEDVDTMSFNPNCEVSFEMVLKKQYARTLRWIVRGRKPWTIASRKRELFYRRRKHHDNRRTES